MAHDHANGLRTRLRAQARYDRPWLTHLMVETVACDRYTGRARRVCWLGGSLALPVVAHSYLILQQTISQPMNTDRNSLTLISSPCLAEPWLTVLLTSLIFATASSVSSSAEIQAGLAQVDITPPIGGKTTGYSAAEPTDGIHDQVSARVLLLQTNQSCIAMVVCDLCIFNSEWLHGQMAEIGVDQLLLMNTHTHSGPNLRQTDFPSEEEPWNKVVEQRILAAIKEAKEELFPAYFTAGEGHIQLGYNRLVNRGDHAVTHFENPDRIPHGPVDPTLGVIRISDDQDAIRAVLVVYACHPVVLGPRNRKISAGYPGVTRNVVEKQLGKQAMCIFVQGAGGDINPLILARGDDRDDDFVMVDRMGQLLAVEVQRVLAMIKDQRGKSEQLLSSNSIMSVGNRWNRQEQVELGVASLLINDSIGIISMPGEPFHHFQVDFREKANLPHAYVFGYCSNGPYRWPSYLPDVVSAARGGYGASDTTVAEVGAGERLVNQGLAQLFALQGRLKSKPQRHIFEERHD